MNNPIRDLQNTILFQEEQISRLKEQNRLLNSEIQFLKEELESEKKRLREAVGAWRRKAQEKGTVRRCLREGYHHERKSHYKVYVIEDLPPDLDIEEVCLALKETFLPTVYPYQFLRCDYSTKYKGWLVEVVKYKYIDMLLYPFEDINSK